MSLDAAYLRVARGRDHLTELERLCDDVSDWYADRLREHYPQSVKGVDALMALFDSAHPEEYIPPKIAILAGEVVHNFRAALDYLVCTLSKTDTPVWTGRKRRNQFPIEHTAGFENRRRTFLAGLSDAHVRALEAYQPYSGCQWTELLARLSNLDKHNDLIVVAQGADIQLRPATSANILRSFSPTLAFCCRINSPTRRSARIRISAASIQLLPVG
jgi:hypothetical protein